MDTLLEWNEKFNLTAITDERDIILKHFVDSLTAVPFLPETGAPLRVIDVGAGAGFPGVPIKIARPDISLTLMDSTRKKINFLTELIDRLGLRGVNAVQARAEEAARQDAYRGRYGCAVCRAVAPLGALAGYCLPMLASGGALLALKGPAVFKEAEDAAKSIKKYGGELVEIAPAFFADMKHYIAVIKKL